MFNDLPDTIAKKHLDESTKAAAWVTRDETRRRAPVWRGILEKNIVAVRHKMDSTITRYKRTYIIKGNKKAFYWYWVEYGTKHARASPYMQPGFMASWQAAARKFSKRMKLAITAETKKYG